MSAINVVCECAVVARCWNGGYAEGTSCSTCIGGCCARRNRGSRSAPLRESALMRAAYHRRNTPSTPYPIRYATLSNTSLPPPHAPPRGLAVGGGRWTTLITPRSSRRSARPFGVCAESRLAVPAPPGLGADAPCGNAPVGTAVHTLLPSHNGGWWTAWVVRGGGRERALAPLGGACAGGNQRALAPLGAHAQGGDPTTPTTARSGGIAEEGREDEGSGRAEPKAERAPTGRPDGWVSDERWRRGSGRREAEGRPRSASGRRRPKAARPRGATKGQHQRGAGEEA